MGIYDRFVLQAQDRAEELGNFSSIKSPAKRSKRIGLLFSSCSAITAAGKSPQSSHHDAIRLLVMLHTACYSRKECSMLLSKVENFPAFIDKF